MAEKEAVATEQARTEAPHAPTKAGARLWLLPRGSRGDVQPYAALAVGLQRAGFEVKVFGIGCYEKLFTTYGVPYERSDACLFWRSEEVVSELCARAAALGLEGPEEYCDLLQQRKYEFLTFFSMKCWKDHSPTTKFMAWLNGTELTYNLLWRGGQELDFEHWSKWEEERYQEYLQAQAALRRVSVKDLAPELQKRRQAYMASLRNLAAQHGRSLQDFNDLLHDEFSQYISQIFTCSFAEGSGGVSSKVIKELSSFNAWHAEGCNLEDYWAEWLAKLPGLGQLWHESTSSYNTKCGQVQAWNVVASARALAPEELPDLVLFPPSMLSTALELKKQLGLSVLLTTSRPPCIQSAAQQMVYSLLIMEERATNFPNLQEMGPVAFSDLLRNPRQLLGIGPDEMPSTTMLPKVCRSSHTWLEAFEAHLHGHWHLSAEQELQAAGEPTLFGGREVKESLGAFLGARAEPPVYVGFGSTPHPAGPKALARLVVGALKLANRRGIFFCSWGRLTRALLEEAVRESGGEDGLGDLADYAHSHVLFLRAAPHEWLFPQCACIVHQPGVGTTDAALRAGVPQVQAEALSGNSSTATRDLVRLLNVGKLLEPGTLGQLTAQQLADAIQAVLADAGIREAAEKVGAEYRQRSGVQGGVQRIGGLLREDAVAGSSASLPDKVATDIYGRELSDNPWADGLYHLYTPKGEFGGRVDVIGGRAFVAGLDSPFCWLRAVSDAEVEGFFLSSVDVAQLSEDGDVFKWGGGQEFHLRHAALARSCEKSCECAVA